MAAPQRISFTGSQGDTLAARLDLPAGPIRAVALFAHCFTCSKDLLAAKRITSELAREGLAVLRFDFTGLGSSEGEFANTNFTSNVADLVLAADALRERVGAPSILIGHSLGGAAVLCARKHIPEVKAVATIGAPADAHHVAQNFAAKLDEIETEGEAEVSLSGRPFRIRRQLLDDLRAQSVEEHIASLKAALLVLHAPRDEVVGIENASRIFTAARHPKSFVSLDDADHLLTRPADAAYAARIVSAWASRFMSAEETAAPEHAAEVRVAETGEGQFQNAVVAGRHRLMADEPESVGGMDTGPTPYDYLAIGLAACTSMTIRMYARHKKLDVGRIAVEIDHAKVHARDCEDCADEVKERSGKIDRFERRVTVEGDIDDATRDKLLEIADKCPVHRTIEAGSAVVTTFLPAAGAADG